MPDGQALSKARELADQIAANGPLAVQAVLQSLRESANVGEKDALARELELLTCPYVHNAEEARLMAEAGADVLVPHVGLTTKGMIGARTALTLDECVTSIQRIHDAARNVRDDVLVICHGGPISEPDDVQYVLDRTKGIVGFYGASSMERLPTEIAIKAHVERFRQVAAG